MRGRPRRIEIAPRWEGVMERWPTSAGQRGGFRVAMDWKKLAMWLAVESFQATSREAVRSARGWRMMSGSEDSRRPRLMKIQPLEPVKRTPLLPPGGPLGAGLDLFLDLPTDESVGLAGGRMGWPLGWSLMVVQVWVTPLG